MAIVISLRASLGMCDAFLQDQITIPTAVTINAKKIPVNACLDTEISFTPAKPRRDKKA